MNEIVFGNNKTVEVIIQDKDGNKLCYRFPNAKLVSLYNEILDPKKMCFEICADKDQNNDLFTVEYTKGDECNDKRDVCEHYKQDAQNI